MSVLKQTSVFDRHYHIAYIFSPQENQGSPDAGVTSVDGDTKSKEDQHYHKLIFIPETPAVYDERGVEVQPAIPSRFDVLKNEGKDPHTHKVEELEIFDRKPTWLKQEEAEDVKEVRSLFKQASKHDGDYLTNAEIDEKYYLGDQWKSSDKNRLKAKKRACLTINEIEGKVDVLSGFYRQNRYDITYFPTENGDQLVADILSNIAKHVQEKNNFDYREVEVFEDKAVTGRGNFKLWIDYNKDIRGDIKIRDYPYDKVVYGEHRDKDCDDLEYLVSWEWMSLNKLKQLYPDKAEKIDDYYNLAKLRSNGTDSDIPDDIRDKYAVDSKYDTKDVWIKFACDSEFVDVTEKKYKVLELHKKVYDKVRIIADLTRDYIEDGFFYEDLDPKTAEKIKTIPGMTLIPRVIESIAVMQTAGAVLLSKEESELGENWSVIPDYAKKRGDKVWGKVRTMRDQQEMINKIHSNTVDIISRMATYGWMYDSNTFPTETAKQKFLAQSSTPGFALEVSSVQTPPMKYEGMKYPNELIQEQEFLSRKMMEISNINPEMLGMSSQSQQSGTNFMQKREGALVGNEFLFDNSSLSKRMLGRALLRAIRIVYGADPERVMKLLKNRISRGNQVVVGNQDFDKWSPEEIMERLTNEDFENYDVVVGESIHSPTKKMATWNYMLQLVQAGLQIPPNIFYELSELPLYIKRQIQAYNDSISQSQQGAEDSKQQAEKQKTAIAALPDAVKENPAVTQFLLQTAVGGQNQQQPEGGAQQ